MHELGPAPRVEIQCRWTAHAAAEEVGRLRREVTGFVEHVGGVPASRLPDLALAVSELVTNTVRHAYRSGPQGDVVVDAGVDGHVEIVVSDTGDGLASGAVVDAAHGLGIVHAVADRVTVDSRHGLGTTVTLVFEP